jgi:hypothetical protein
MIDVLVRDENGGKRARIDADLLKKLGDALAGQPRVDENARAARFDVGCVPGGTAAQGTKFHRVSDSVLSLRKPRRSRSGTTVSCL